MTDAATPRADAPGSASPPGPIPAGTERAPCVAVPLEEGEALRRKLRAEGLLRADLEVRREGDRLLLPVSGEVPGWTVTEADFEVVPQAPKDYRDLLALPDDVTAALPTSFDRIGDVVVFKLADDLLEYRAMVGAALEEFVAGCRTVALDRGVKGPYRVRDLEVVAGERGTATVHREHGVEMHVDPATAYFSPRLATERRRVADQVADGERVVDAFAGVGPFSLVIARHARPARVVAIELNPDAYRFLARNVGANGAGDVVVPVEGDAGELLADHGPADRIVMNLPHAAEGYLDAAQEALAPGGTVHLYAVVEAAELGARRQALADRGFDVADVREVHTYSPTSAVMAFDLRDRGEEV